MDNEQFERQKEFILQQQAQFAAKIGQLEDGLARQGENIERLGENVARLEANVARLVDVVERVVDTVERLAQGTTERFEETDRKIAALADAQIRSEDAFRKMSERIDNLAATVDRHIAEGHNGRARPES